MYVFWCLYVCNTCCFGTGMTRYFIRIELFKLYIFGLGIFKCIRMLKVFKVYKHVDLQVQVQLWWGKVHWLCMHNYHITKVFWCIFLVQMICKIFEIYPRNRKYSDSAIISFWMTFLKIVNHLRHYFGKKHKESICCFDVKR